MAAPAPPRVVPDTERLKTCAFSKDEWEPFYELDVAYPGVASALSIDAAAPVDRVTADSPACPTWR